MTKSIGYLILEEKLKGPAFIHPRSILCIVGKLKLNLVYPTRSISKKTIGVDLSMSANGEPFGIDKKWREKFY